MTRVLWLSTCGPDMWAASGKKLVDTFVRTKSEGHLALFLEGMTSPVAANGPRVSYHDMGYDAWLDSWLLKNADIIPTHLGGGHPEPACKCPGGPLDPHAKTHRQPCVGHWFNRNASRWFRKIASLRQAYALLVDPSGKGLQYDAIVWVDSDVTFRRQVTAHNVAGWFHRTKACFYLKHTRPVMEAGVVGYQLPAAEKLLDAIFARYESGRFRADPRWDDSYQIQLAIKESKVSAVDIAYGLGPNAGVVTSSAVGPFLAHAKGHHRRTSVMT